ncbi:MAG: class I SAM-dependent methyltransferase [Patescibacteria group bacterium]
MQPIFEKENFNEKRYATHELGKPDDVRVKKIADLVGSGKTVLDIGCCDGYIGSFLIKNGNKVYGTDISKTCVDKANSKGLVAKFLDIEKGAIPFNTKFHTVIAGEIIEHVTDTSGFLQKIKKTLKKDGELIITTPNTAALGRRLLLLFGKNPHLEVSFEPYSAGHVRYFIKESLIWLLEKNGFKVTHYTSDIVNFNASGSVSSKTLADLLPTLGKTLIVKSVKI